MERRARAGRFGAMGQRFGRQRIPVQHAAARGESRCLAW